MRSTNFACDLELNGNNCGKKNISKNNNEQFFKTLKKMFEGIDVYACCYHNSYSESESQG